MNISKNFMIAMIGITGILGITSVCLVDKTRKLDKSMDDMSDKIAGDLDIEIPDRVISLAMQKAADREAKKASKLCSDTAGDHIADLVGKEFGKVRASIEPDIKKEIAQQISLLDIESMKDEVVKEAAKSVVQNATSSLFNKKSDDNTAEIIRACKEVGVTSPYYIQEIIEASRK